MTQEECMLTYLDRDPVHFADMYEVLRRGSGVIHYAGADGVILSDRVSGSYFMSAVDNAAAGRLLDLLPSDCKVLCGHETGYLLEAATRLRLGDVQLCYNALYRGSDPIPLPRGTIPWACWSPSTRPM